MADAVALQQQLDQALHLLQQMYFFACGRPTDWRVVETVRELLTNNQLATGNALATKPKSTQKICDN